MAGGEHRTARQRPSGRLRRPGHALLPRLAHPRQGRPHNTRSSTANSASSPVNHRLRAARTGDDPDLIDSLNDLILEPGDKLRGIKALRATAPPRGGTRAPPPSGWGEGGFEGLFDLRDNDIASRATQHRRQHPPHFDLLRRHGRQRPPPIRLIPGQRRHPRHRHHRPTSPARTASST